MRLSEAIRLGAMIRPQAFWYYFRDGASCAFGGALEAVGMDYTETPASAPDAVRLRWPWLWKTDGPCPACLGHATPRQIIAHLNNNHRWTREQIADWVESLEAREESRALACRVNLEADCAEILSVG